MAGMIFAYLAGIVTPFCVYALYCFATDEVEPPHDH